MTLDERNEEFAKYQHLIRIFVYRNSPLLYALGIDFDDAYQELSIAALKAIEKFDPDKDCSMNTYLNNKLKFAILDLKRQHKPIGITGAKNERPEFTYLDAPTPYDIPFEIPSQDDNSIIYFKEASAMLNKQEKESVNQKIQGHFIRRKADKENIASAADKLKEYLCV